MAASNPSDSAPSGKPNPIAFIDLAAQQALIRDKLDIAIADVLASGAYVMGPQVPMLEAQLAEFCGAKHTICCSSGTDALLIALMAWEIGPGDAVICPAFTYTATPEVIALLGATGVFVDVHEDTFNIDPDRVEGAIAAARSKGLKPKAIIPVDLFGQPAEYDAILPFAEKHGLKVLCDAAQGFGATFGDKRVGQIGDITATSFFPAKPLGCYGDGGAVFTDDDEIANILRSITLHGKGAAKYDVVRVGINGRLDTIQAAVLIEKLKLFPGEIEARNRIATRFSEAFAGKLPTPVIRPGNRSVWAQYTLRFPAKRRDEIAARLKEAGIPTAVYYPRPLHHQPAYRHHLLADGGAPVSERLAREVLSLPFHPYLDEGDQNRIIEAVLQAV